MTSKLVLFILGIAIGAGVCVAVLSKQSQNETTTSALASATALSNQVAGLESSLTSAKSRLEQAEQVNDTLSARVQELMKQKEAVVAAESVSAEPPTKRTGLAALFGGDGTNEISEAMSAMMKTAIEQQIEAKLAGMKSKLNLTPEQEKTIRDIMTKQMSRGTEVAQKMFKGELTQEEMEKLGKDQPNEREQIKALLTPEQLAAYDEFEKEEQTRMARLVANSELMQMQSQLQLSEEQQDTVFAVLADQALTQFDAKATNRTGAPGFHGQFDKKAEALKEVLTAEQFDRYKKFQEQQLKMIEAFMPRSASNASVHVTPVIAQ